MLIKDFAGAAIPVQDEDPRVTRWRWLMWLGEISLALAAGALFFGKADRGELDMLSVLHSSDVMMMAEIVTQNSEQIAGLEEAEKCTSLKSQIEDKERELYEIRREIEMAGGAQEVPDIVLERLDVLQRQLERDNESYRTFNCPRVLG